MHVMNAPVPAAAETADRQTVRPATAPGGLAPVREEHARSEGPYRYALIRLDTRLDSRLDTRWASPRGPASIAAIGLQGVLSEASRLRHRSDQRRKNSKRRTSKNRVPTGKMRMYHPPLNSTKSKVMQVTWYNLTLDLRL